MRKSSEMFLNIKANMDGAQESLRAMSQLADSWKKFNEMAANRLQSSLNLRRANTEKTDKDDLAPR